MRLTDYFMLHTRDMSMLLCAAMLVIAVGLPSLGESTIGPPYRAEQKMCDQDRDCDRTKGEVCWKLYDGCYHGVCMCDPDKHVLDEATGICRLFKYGNELCTDADICLNGMICLNGTCQCPRGDMTEEGNFCLMPRHRILGETCNPSSDVCLQKSVTGYTLDDVRCIQGRCSCQKGYQPDGKSCRKPAGARCTLMYECQGGFMCLNGRCRCPNNYRAVAGNSKCANINALVDLPLGSACDEINESKYCATGLICHRCHKERDKKCVRYFLSQAETEYLTGSGSSSSYKVCVISVLICLWLSREIYDER